MADYKQVHDDRDGLHSKGTCGVCDAKRERLAKKVKFRIPRPDYRWVAGEGPRLHEPTRVPRRLPAPPEVAVMVPSDIAETVKEYAKALSTWYDMTERRIEG